jgi:hypothetical protein
MVWLWVFVGQLIGSTAWAYTMIATPAGQVLITEEKSATNVPTANIAATNIRKATVYFLTALRVIAICRNAIPDIALPSRIKS